MAEPASTLYYVPLTQQQLARLLECVDYREEPYKKLTGMDAVNTIDFRRELECLRAVIHRSDLTTRWLHYFEAGEVVSELCARCGHDSRNARHLEPKSE